MAIEGHASVLSSSPVDVTKVYRGQIIPYTFCAFTVALQACTDTTFPNTVSETVGTKAPKPFEANIVLDT